MEERTDSGELSAPSVRATGVIIETQRLRMRAHRDDDLAHLVVLAGNWEIARWTAAIPHPYRETDGRDWTARARQELWQGMVFAGSLRAESR